MSLDEERVHAVFERLGRQLTKLRKPAPRNVHQFRTATRRLEAILEELVSSPDRSQRKLLKQLSRLRRRAGRVRDIDVQIAALTSLKASDEPGRKIQLLRSLAELRGKRETKLLRSLDESTLREIRKRLKRVRDGFHLPEPAPEPVALARQMFARAAGQQKALSEEVLHQYRVEGKRIRYIAELAAHSLEAERMVENLKRMQDALGEWHDWLALTQTAQEFLGEGARSALLAALKNITRAKFRDAIEAVTEAKAALVPSTRGEARPPTPASLPAKRIPVSSERTAAAAIA